MTTALESHVMPTYRRWPVTFDSGNGCTLVDTGGREYLDLVAGLAVASVGHAHPAVTAAIADQASRLVHVSNLYRTVPQQELAAHLASLTNGKLSFFCNSGAEAVECALTLARKHGAGKHRIVAADGGFHGRTFGALSATGQPAKRAAFEPIVPGFDHVPYGDVAALEAAIGDDCAAVLLEPIQGEAGVVVPPDGYLRAARELTERCGALLILDEVQTGIARTGRWFAYEAAGIEPDVVCVAKGLGAGLPIGACLAAPEVAASFEPGDHATTFGGGPVQCAAALAVLDVIEEEQLLANVQRASDIFVERLGGLAHAVEVRGSGLLLGVVLDGPNARAVVESALALGVLINDAAPEVVRICPPLTISEQQARAGADAVARAIAEAAA